MTIKWEVDGSVMTIKQFTRVLIGNWMSWGSTLYNPQNVKPCRSRDKAILCLIDLIKSPCKLHDVWKHFTWHGNDMPYAQFKIELTQCLHREWEEEILYRLGGI